MQSEQCIFVKVPLAALVKSEIDMLFLLSVLSIIFCAQIENDTHHLPPRNHKEEDNVTLH